MFDINRSDLLVLTINLLLILTSILFVEMDLLYILSDRLFQWWYLGLIVDGFKLVGLELLRYGLYLELVNR